MKKRKRELNTEDLYKPLQSQESELLGDQLENYWTNEVTRATAKKQTPSLMRALLKMIIYDFFFSGLPLLFYTTLSVIQPIFLSDLLRNMSDPNNTPTNIQMRYVYGGCIIIVTLIRIFLFNHFNALNFILGMKIRIACCSLLNRKMLKLSHAAMGQITAGHLVNLLSNDVNRFDIGLPFVQYFWVMPIQLIIGIVIVWYQVGVSAITGIVAMVIITIPIQGFLGKLSSKYRLKVANRTDTRVKHMSEIIGGIQVIKMYAWEKPFELLIDAKRRHEVSGVKKSAILKAIYLGLIVFTDRVSLFITIVCYTLFGFNITSDMVFSLAQFFNVMQMSMAIGFPMGVNMGAEIYVSIKRIQEYLLLEENPVIAPQQNKSSKNNKECGVILKNINASWGPSSEWSLKNINLNIQSGSLCTVIGSVGAGKSSILHLIIKELLPSSGSLKVGGNISYASQEPWLFVSTVRENILFGNPYDKDRYRDVVRVCALESDFKQFPYGDKTVVGERGVSLSGGQRARINLARAVYKQSDIYILDDPLSAVDAHVSRHLFDECISGYLRNKTRILVTHQLQFLKKADLIVVVDDGELVAQGTFLELAESNLDITNFINVETEEEKKDKPEKKVELSRRMSIVSQASTVIENCQMDLNEEEMGKSGPLYWPYFKSGKNYCLLFFTVLLFVIAQATLNCSDLWLTYWLNEKRNNARDDTLLDANATAAASNHTTTRTIGSTSFRPSNSTFPHQPERTRHSFVLDHALDIYSALMIFVIILTFMRSIMFVLACMKSSINLHNNMFHHLLQSYMRFFDTNPSGRILNRFSKDMGIMDEIIPRTMLEAIQVMLVMTGIFVVILITNIYMVVALIVLGVFGFKLAVLYTNAAKDIKRMEGISRSPVFSHVKASYDGLATIRSSFAQNKYKLEFDELQDTHTSAWYMTIATRTAFAIWLDICTVVFITAVVFSFIFLNQISEFFDDSKAGLAISQSMILTGMVQMGSQQTTEVINQMTCVERILEYTKLDTEKLAISAQNAIKGIWPSQGKIEFKRMFLKYAPTEPAVLKNLNFSISAGQKVGIVGRTGAGKSSIISALFRLSSIEGNILIDNVDTKNVEIGLLRSKISIIPQVPVLFSASVRYNLDPFNEYDDEAIWNSLDEVELKDAVPNLEYAVHEGGANFSVGQRQLLCLARAILRNNKILILDEATANVDQQTDALIQSTIRRKFSTCTVLTIAHRLNTIMDSDAVIVMHAGELVEMGHPYILLQNTDGFFSKLVQDNEASVAKKLQNMASQTYLDTLMEEEHTDRKSVV